MHGPDASCSITSTFSMFYSLAEGTIMMTVVVELRGWMSIDGLMPDGLWRNHVITFSCGISLKVAFHSVHSQRSVNIKSLSPCKNVNYSGDRTVPKDLTVLEIQTKKAAQWGSRLTPSQCCWHVITRAQEFPLTVVHSHSYWRKRWVNAKRSEGMFALRTTLAAEQTPSTPSLHTLKVAHSKPCAWHCTCISRWK